MPRQTSLEHTVITPGLLRGWPVGTDRRETVLVLGSARTVPGAVVLSGTAALRAGAGTLQLAASERHAAEIGVAVPESSVIGLPESESGAVSRKAAAVLTDALTGAGAVVIGPGLTDPAETLALLDQLLPQIPADARVVLDAYALGALSRRPELAGQVAGRLVLTPNTTEAAFLLGQGKDDISDYGQAAVRIAERYRAVVTLMGAVADLDGSLWLDTSGHIGLGTSGSGDVLAGLAGGFLARGAEAAQAACWATHVHAVAGQRLIPRTGLTGMLARELVAEAPQVIAELTQ
jgi:hydroxyethylthiazole kinase-like uncharacterized protein yjeF